MMTKIVPTIGIALLMSFSTGSAAFAQDKVLKAQLLGSWSLVSVASELDDGTKVEPFGTSPRGNIIFSDDGHFSLFQSRADLPKIAGIERAKATPEEARAIVAGSLAQYGTYLIDDNTKLLTLKITGSTYANEITITTNQKKKVTLLTLDELKFEEPRTSVGATMRTAWKRSPP